MNSANSHEWRVREPDADFLAAIAAFNDAFPEFTFDATRPFSDTALETMATLARLRGREDVALRLEASVVARADAIAALYVPEVI